MTYISRKIDEDLLTWKSSTKHKPLLLRGARQVGKSSSVRELGKKFHNIVEINFERDDKELNVKSVFERGLDVKRICDELSALYKQPIRGGETLLFLDEIQSCIPAILSLRYFYEEMPDLHVIAAGSLLEFALEEIPTFGVGRVRSLFMYPFSFDEYLHALHYDILANTIKSAAPKKPLSDAIHHKAVELWLKFILIGGLPEVVSTYADGGSLTECQQLLEELATTYYNDFAKYKEKVPTSRLREIFTAIIHQTGGKFTYKHASQNATHLQIKECINLLTLAGLIYPVTHTAANGLPLGAEINLKYRKYLIFDTGIYQNILGLDISNFFSADSLQQVNKGSLIEMFVGLELLKSMSNYSPQNLFYWHRDVQGSSAEVDYVIQKDTTIVPIEVKAGSRGSMQSMFQFLSDKNYSYGIRCALENFSEYDKIKVYPAYAAGNIRSATY
ncbi:MAG: ATP-binding protein [Bacteroidales bacterium]|jgi:predicted AAA+ superfamily ATPase|nr:ATP-binding protein [Bacteroidales bacterium]